MDAGEARRRFAAARVARLATADHGAQPHLVPIVFAVAGDTIYTAVDAKPKRSTALRRIANVQANPHVSVLTDHYDDADWDTLWWVRADGTARIVKITAGQLDDEGRRAIDLLAARYPQYRNQPPVGPVLAIDVTRWTGWSAHPGG
jgi:PPOX class probable F420-dependent enzyme